MHTTPESKQQDHASAIDGGKRYWNRHAKNYERSMALLGGPLTKAAQLAAASVAGASRVLEVGAGTGLVTMALGHAAAELVATDYAAAMVDTLAQKATAAGLTNIACEQADIYALRFAPASFDAVVAANVLHLVPDFPGAVRALRKVLKPGGRFIAPTFCHDETPLAWAVSRLLALSGFPGHRRFTSRRLRQALEAEALRITSAELLPGVIPILYVEGVFS